MKKKLVVYKQSWRDILVVLTAVLVLGSLVLVGYGINQNNKLAGQAKDHIDCIIKDLSTPLPPGAKARVIDYQTRLSSDCKIKFN